MGPNIQNNPENKGNKYRKGGDGEKEKEREGGNL